MLFYIVLRSYSVLTNYAQSLYLFEFNDRRRRRSRYPRARSRPLISDECGLDRYRRTKLIKPPERSRGADAMSACARPASLQRRARKVRRSKAAGVSAQRPPKVQEAAPGQASCARPASRGELEGLVHRYRVDRCACEALEAAGFEASRDRPHAASRLPVSLRRPGAPPRCRARPQRRPRRPACAP